MTEHIYTVEPEQEHHQGGVRTLLSKAFGHTRMQRAIYRMREGVPPDPALCFVIINKHDLVLGVVRNYRVRVGDSPRRALLLGPIATAHSHERMGLASQLVNRTIEEATAQGFAMIYLVGDPKFYGEFGFVATAAAQTHIAGLEDGKVILGLELISGAALDMTGEIIPDNSILLEQLR